MRAIPFNECLNSRLGIPYVDMKKLIVAATST